MASVTQRIKDIKQPYGGYVKPREFEKTELNDGNELGEENIHSSLVGTAVDYMTRYLMGTPVEDAFRISLIGSRRINDEKYSAKLVHNINGLDDKSIDSACKLVGYDVCVRAGSAHYKDVRNINPDESTINNIRIMVERSLKFFEEYGPIVKDGFHFEGGYTNTIDSGDGDYLTEDTLWDFKVSSKPPKTAHTLQLLVYYLMGTHSINEEFGSIKKLGIFNPRLNCVFLKSIEDIPDDVIETVSKEVIGYGKDDTDNADYTGNITANLNDELTIADVMSELQCSRHMVMKYYAEQGLPLTKRKNRYYIKRIDLYDWINKILEERKRIEEERKKIERRNLIISLIVFLPFIIYIVYLIWQFLK